ncbi:MAG: glycosyltransferase [Holosporaceae bacterium]|jgi:glycosyltransferase involved in cell wall biosynthesis|nr:glycosyltransferase [Holosporaceae bacterium]
MNNVAVLIPCYNEASTIAMVVRSFRKYLPHAAIYVYDNCSEDNTAELARNAGAIVVTARIRGKGNVVRRMFADINADIYIMVDGDLTYTAADAPSMINTLVKEKVDMVVAVRREKSGAAFPMGHKLGNRAFNFILKILFHSTFQDVFSGYRAFSKRFVKTFPVTSSGFDIEAELSIHALTLAIPCSEIESMYLERPSNSSSKLSSFRDGFQILIRIIKLLKETRPLFFFGIIFLLLFLISIIISYPVVVTFINTGLVPRFPTTILSSGLTILSFLSLACGIIMDSISKARREVKKLHYLHFS